MFRFAAACLFGMLTLASAAHARSPVGVATNTAQRCEQAMVGGSSHSCDMIANNLYDDGVQSFAFFDTNTPQRFSVSFLGNTQVQKFPAGSKFRGPVAEVPIVLVSFAVTQPNGTVARDSKEVVSGVCRYGSPAGNGIIELSCTAKLTNGATIFANFQSDGKPTQFIDPRNLQR